MDVGAFGEWLGQVRQGGIVEIILQLRGKHVLWLLCRNGAARDDFSCCPTYSITPFLLFPRI